MPKLRDELAVVVRAALAALTQASFGLVGAKALLQQVRRHRQCMIRTRRSSELPLLLAPQAKLSPRPKDPVTASIEALRIDLLLLLSLTFAGLRPGREDSYVASTQTRQGRFAGFLLHRAALLRRFSTG